jgi:2-amino-4-hydroxy-6-hydroxymethyldihydropteridine diphosphokinase
MPDGRLVYIALGSNIGDRDAMLDRGIEALNAAGVHVLRQSARYASEPVDAPPQAWFLNAVVEAETALMPLQLLRTLMGIELALGRRRTVFRGPRTLDLDILFYGSSVIHTQDLEVPHPRMERRRFVLLPLAELVPGLRHPVSQKTVSELLAEAPDAGHVRRWSAPPDPAPNPA